MKAFLLGLLGFALVGVLVLIVFGAVFLFDTQYAAGYSEQSFRSVKMGDPEHSVISKLGTPFGTNHCEPYASWVYSADKQPHFERDGRARGTYTMVTFKKGSVDSITGVTVNSSTLMSQTMTLGDGEGYLKLTRDKVEGLKGASPDLIKDKLGAPLAVYEFKARRTFSYSRSPSSGNYRLRRIGFDEAGKVIYIGKSIYWD